MADGKNILSEALRACSPRLFSVIFFSFFINLLMFVAPIHMLQMYDRVLVSRSEVTLLVLTLLAVGLLLIYGILEAVRSRLLVRTGIKFDELMSKRVFGIVFDAALASPKHASSQGLRDADQIREFIGGGAIIALCDAPWVPIFIGVCFVLHPVLGFVALSGAIVIFLLALVTELGTRKRLSEANQLNVRANNNATSSLRNVEIVKALGMVSGVKESWNHYHDGALVNQTIASDRAGAILASSRSVRMILQVVILATGAYLAIQDLITPGTMIAASIIMGRALAPVELAVSQWRNFVSVRDAYKRLSELIEAQPESQETMDLPSPTGEITLEHVFVRPPGTELVVLNDVSLRLQAGTVTGIIGPSGCGKSSLVRSIVGVWPVIRGAVRYDGANINNWKSENLGPFIGYMPQDVELFSGSVAQNIARFQDIDSSAVVQAAQKAGVHELILKLPEGYDTNIGVGGIGLSGGQRQRIALARALYKDPKVVVLDEPNSSLDVAGEKALADAITQSKTAGANLIVVSHRPSLLAVADNIAVLNAGTLVKFGPRDNILAELGGGNIAARNGPKPANN